jgi:hypothetical protein
MSRFLPRAVVLAALTAAAAAGCSSSGDEPTALPSGPGLTTTAAAPTTAAPTSAALSPEPSVGTQRSPIRWLGPAEAGGKAAVQETTRSYWSMVVRLAEKPDPDDPQIAQLSSTRRPASWSRCSPTSRPRDSASAGRSTARSRSARSARRRRPRPRAWTRR